MSLHDSSTKREIARRNKRDQLQINISSIDSLKEGDLKTDKLSINLQDLSTEIVRKCPLLLSERNNLEDIQLHLLYLINRRQSQLLTRASDEISQSRPPSSASSRVRSAQASKIGTLSARRSSIVSTGEHFHETKIGDIYCYLHAKGCSDEAEDLNSHIEDFLDSFDEYLTLIEEFKAKNVLIEGEKIEKLDQYLEGLYGENEERFVSMIFIRKLCKNDLNLSKICLNKLLICAMFRTLRESEGKEHNLGESILYCLIKFTYFLDSYYQVFVNTDQVDLIKIVVDFLVDHLKSLRSNQSQELKLLQDYYYYTNSFLVIIINLLRIDNKELLIKNKILKQYGKIFLNTLLETFKLNTKYINRDIRFISKPERFIKTQSRIVFILTQLSQFKEFIHLLRAEHHSIHDSIVGLINVLQLSRPGSGASNTDSSRVVNDKQLLYELFELEIDIFRLVNNLIFDNKLKIRLTKKNLLKCVLRNLVVFLASRKSNTLNPFDRSPVLVVPFKCLYELSCTSDVKSELYKSKIILKCLLEYLLSSAVDLKPALGLKHPSLGTSTTESKTVANQADPPDQISIEPTMASHYILGIWINLSAKSEATIYGDDSELTDLVYEYIDLAINNLRIFLVQIQNFPMKSSRLKREHPMIYLHLKLLRNITQFLDFREPPLTSSIIDYYKRWTSKLAETSSELLNVSCKDQNLIPLTVECLATLDNLMSKINSLLDRNESQFSNNISQLKPPQMSLLMDRLFVLDFSKLSVDNDDLLLILIIFIGNLAKYWEICDILNEKICSEILVSCNFILNNKTTDQEMISNTLYTLAQLIKHPAFLSKLKSFLPTNKLELNNSLINEQLDNLLNKFASLTLHGNMIISRFAILLLDQFRHLEGSQGSIFERRFSIYNTKWLDAMRTSREGLLETNISDISRYHKVKASISLEGQSEEEEPFGTDDGDEFEHLKAVGDEVSERTVSTCSSTKVSSLYPVMRGENNCENKDTGSGGDEDDEDELDEDEENFEGPDLNVIDQNSMIKHLTTRREFRSEWLSR